jgi:hypothetical protein
VEIVENPWAPREDSYLGDHHPGLPETMPRWTNGGQRHVGRLASVESHEATYELHGHAGLQPERWLITQRS